MPAEDLALFDNYRILALLRIDSSRVPLSPDDKRVLIGFLHDLSQEFSDGAYRASEQDVFAGSCFRVRLNPRRVPLDDFDTSLVEHFLSIVATEFDKGDHWGSTLFYLNLPNPSSAANQRDPHPDGQFGHRLSDPLEG
jgi:hypothetical protein